MHKVQRVHIREADDSDSAEVFEWRNDMLSRAMSRDSEAVSWQQHVRWFDCVLAEQSKLLLICEHSTPTSPQKIGVVRFDLDSRRVQAEISINLAPNMRGKGFAKACLQNAIQHFLSVFPDCRTILADIKTENESSKKSFLGVGFKQISQSESFIRCRFDA